MRELENAVEGAVAMTTTKVITDDLLLPTRDPEGKGLRLLKDAKQNFEREYLVQLVELTGGNVSQAAKLSGKHRADLYELLRKHNLDPGKFRK